MSWVTGVVGSAVMLAVLVLVAYPGGMAGRRAMSRWLSKDDVTAERVASVVRHMRRHWWPMLVVFPLLMLSLSADARSQWTALLPLSLLVCLAGAEVTAALRRRGRVDEGSPRPGGPILVSGWAVLVGVVAAVGVTVASVHALRLGPAAAAADGSRVELVARGQVWARTSLAGAFVTVVAVALVLWVTAVRAAGPDPVVDAVSRRWTAHTAVALGVAALGFFGADALWAVAQAQWSLAGYATEDIDSTMITSLLLGPAVLVIAVAIATGRGRPVPAEPQPAHG